MFKTEPTAPHVKPGTVWQYLVEAEERVWGHGMIDVDVSHSSESQTSDVGDLLLRHGLTGRKIHDYFSNLEARKCCLKLRLEARKTTFSNIRLVRHDGRDSGIEEGAMMKTPLEHRANVAQLDSSNFQVFKRAYLCAAFPVLGAPEPPSAFSPSPVQNTSNQRLSYSSIVSISRPTTPHSIPDSGLDDTEEDTTSLIPAETLCELLKRAFRLSDQKFTHYERSISESYGKHTQQKVLAEELVNQLAALENNSNPFYNPHTFKDDETKTGPEHIRKGYDHWQQQEREHLTELINKFWHFSLPTPGANFSTELAGLHEDYRKLLAKLIRYESPYKSDREDLGPTPVSTLSSASVRLLREFGLRYGVGEQYRKFVYLHYLAQHFDPTVWYIQHATMTLKNIADWLPSNRNHLTITQQEFGIIESSLHLLLGQAGNAITKMKRLFPHNRPPDGVASLIELLGISLTLKSYLSMKPIKPLQECLRQYVQEAYVTAYERHKLLAMAELQQSSSSVQMCPTLLNILIVNIRDEVNDYRMNYQSTFDRYFNLTESAAQAFYTYLMSDVLHLCQSVTENAVTPEIDLLMLSLAYRLNNLDHDWARYIPPESQRWREPFLILTVQWTMALHGHVPLLVLDAVGVDKFKTQMLPGNIRSPTVSSSCQRGRSTSLRSLSASVRSAFSSVSSTRSTPVAKEPQNVLQYEAGGKFINKQPPILETSTEASPPRRDDGARYLYTNPANTIRDGQVDKSRRTSTHSVDAAVLRHDHSAQAANEMEEDEVMSFTRQNLRHSNSLPNFFANHGNPISYLPHLTGDSKRNDESFHLNAEKSSTGNLNDGISPKDLNPKIPAVEVNGSHSAKSAKMQNDKDSSSDEEELASVYPPLMVIKSDPTASRFGTVMDRNIPHIEAEVGGRIETVPPHLKTLVSPSKGLTRVPSAPIVSQSTMLSDHLHSSRTSSLDVNLTSSLQERPGGDSEIHEFMDSLRSDFTSVSMPTHRSVEFRTVNAPMSSSLIDLLIILQRVTGVARTFCETICPLSNNDTGLHRHGYWDNVSLSSEDMEDVAYCQDNAGARCQLFLLFSRTVCQSLCIFTDNMLCMDLCGLSLLLARRLVGPKLVEYLQSQRHGGLIWGCRHDIAGARNGCYYYIDRKTFLLCDRYEPVVEEMCTRINNVAALFEYLKKYYENICTIFGIHDNHDVTNFLSDTEETGYESGFLDDYVVIDSYYDMEYEHLPHFEASSLFNTPRHTPVQGMKVPIFPVVHCWRHIMSVLRGMCRILAYRLNLFLRDALALLLSPDMPVASVTERLKPVRDFLSDNLTALSNWLYRDSFRRILQYVWLYIVEDFEEELSKLRTGEFNTEKQAEMLTHALSYLIRFMNNMGKGVHLDQLLAYSEDVSFKLQLYTLTTSLLSLLYENLIHYYSDSSEHITTQNDIPRSILRRMKLDLQYNRKCFSGRQLVSWLLRNQERGLIAGQNEFIDGVDPETGRSVVSRDVAVHMAQKLLDQAVIVDMEYDPSLSGRRTHTSSVLSEEIPYPHVSIHTNLEDQSYDSEINSENNANEDSGSGGSRSSSTTTTTIQEECGSENSDATGSVDEQNHNQFREVSADHDTSSGEIAKGDNPMSNVNETNLGTNPCDKLSGENESEDIDEETRATSARNNMSVDNLESCLSYEKRGDKLDEGSASNDDWTVQVSAKHDNTRVKCQDDARQEHDQQKASKEKDGKHGKLSEHLGEYKQTESAASRTSTSTTSQDTGSCATSNGSCAQFQDTPKKFYLFNPEGEEFGTGPMVPDVNPSYTRSGAAKFSKVKRELLVMVETCFHKKITPDYLLLILYARRKYDPTAKQFFKNIPDHIINRLCCEVDAPYTCFES